MPGSPSAPQQPPPALPEWMTTQWWGQSETRPGAPAAAAPAAAGEPEGAGRCAVGWCGRRGSGGTLSAARDGYGAAGGSRLPPMIAAAQSGQERPAAPAPGAAAFPTESPGVLPAGPAPARGTGADDPPPREALSQGQRAGLAVQAARHRAPEQPPPEVPPPAPEGPPVAAGCAADDDDDIDVVAWGDIVGQCRQPAPAAPPPAEAVQAPPSAQGSESDEEGDADEVSLPSGSASPELLALGAPSGAESSPTAGSECSSGSPPAGRQRGRRRAPRHRAPAAAGKRSSSGNGSGSDDEGAAQRPRARFPPRPKRPSSCFIAKSAVVRLCPDAKELRRHYEDFKDARRGRGEAVQWGVADSCLGAAGTVSCVYPSGCVAVVFPEQRLRLKLPPSALQLLCSPVRGPAESTAGELELAAQVVAALRSQQGFWVGRDFLDPELAEAVRLDAEGLCAEEDQMIQGGTGKGGSHRRDGVLRGDSIRWMPKQTLNACSDTLPDALQQLHERLHRLRKAIALLLNKTLPRASIQLAKYPGDGKGYVKHRDVKLGPKGDGPDRRRITCLFYCNKDWKQSDGGQLAIYPQTRNPQWCLREGDGYGTKGEKQRAAFAEQLTVEPRLNTLLVFQSHTYHEVLPDWAPRVAFTYWMYGSESLGLTYPGAEEDMDAGEGMKGPLPGLDADIRMRREAAAARAAATVEPIS
eukprot:TRINITY_DN15848_c0_g1_i1.p1 TRINITY_DN15848_c0_g1~~TRINITY_DN15848_c0_g1_i1.p1  ORF type:complete len:696 (+),score=232.30 TRINITY_DN15848_c0_g1_i1:92-2179(+)